MKDTKPEFKKKNILFIVLFIVAVLMIAGDWALSVEIYNENFNQRFESYEPLMLYVDDFDGLQRTKYEFSSNEGKKQVGNGICLMLPFVKLHERIQYGGYASNTALDGFSKSNAAVMLVHSFDDEVVPAEYGYDIYYEEYKDDSRFAFIPFENKGHNYFNNDTYRNEFNTGFDEWLKTLDYDYATVKNSEQFSEDKASYIHQNLDRERWCNSLDLELFEGFVDFYDEHIN